MSADPLVIATQRIGARLARQWFERPRAADPLPMSEAVLAAMLTSAASEGAAVALREAQATTAATADTLK